MKICTKCKIKKELSEYNKNKNNNDGLTYWCKSCSRNQRQLNKEKYKIAAKINAQRPEVIARKKKYDQERRKTPEYKKMKAESDRKYREKNKEKIAQQSKKYREENKEKIIIDKKNEYIRNKNKYIKKANEWMESNKDRWREIQKKSREKYADRRRIYNKIWALNNKDKVCARTQLRNSRKLKQTPPDADLELIAKYYKKSSEISIKTKIDHHVDHIIPLSKGGLHHQDNLQIIPALINLQKGNKLDFVVDPKLIIPLD